MLLITMKALCRFMNEYYNGECQELNMRCKENGWNWGRYSWKMRLSDNTV